MKESISNRTYVLKITIHEILFFEEFQSLKGTQMVQKV